MHTCPTCRRQFETDITGICASCQISAARMLHEIRATWYKAHGELLPGAGGHGTAGSEPNIGVNVAALSWINGTPILNILGEWERLVREERSLAPVGTLKPLALEEEIGRLVTFHLAHMDWTALQPWADEYVVELRDLHAQGRSAARETDDAGMRIGCPGELPEGGLCGKRLAVPSDPEAIVYCKQCGTSWDQRRLAAVAMSVADIEVMLPLAEVAHLTGVPERTLYRWAKTGIVAKRGMHVNLKHVLAARGEVA